MIPNFPILVVPELLWRIIIRIPATLVVGILIRLVFLHRYGTRNLSRLPPGPKKLPIVGNGLSMPNDAAWVTYARWGKECSQAFFVPGHLHRRSLPRSRLWHHSHRRIWEELYHH